MSIFHNIFFIWSSKLPKKYYFCRFNWRKIITNTSASQGLMYTIVKKSRSDLDLSLICPLKYERVYLPLYKVADTPFHISKATNLFEDILAPETNYLAGSPSTSSVLGKFLNTHFCTWPSELCTRTTAKLNDPLGYERMYLPRKWQIHPFITNGTRLIYSLITVIFGVVQTVLMFLSVRVVSILGKWRHTYRVMPGNEASW